MIDATEIASVVSAHLRVNFIGASRFEAGHQVLSLRFADLPAPNGFTIDIKPSWRRLEGALLLDTYAGPIVTAMSNADAEKRALFLALAQNAIECGIRFDVVVNDAAVDVSSFLPSPPWQRFKISCSKFTAASTEGAEVLKSEVLALSVRFTTLLLSLLPFEEAAEIEIGLPEGAKTRVEVNRYERSLVNRAACIAVHGTTCAVCDFDFEAHYGELGKGYIEVHHRTPVSQMGGAYVLNPVTDLVPLCANCHAMVHRKAPPVAPEVLKEVHRNA